MKRLAFSFAALLFISLVAFDAQAKESWTSVRSQNFTLVGNASEREIRSVAVRLEEYRSLLARLFNREAAAQTVPTTVIVFKNDDAFKPFRPLYQGRVADVSGFFQPGHDLNYIAVSADRKGDDSYATIFHELVHLFVDGEMRGLPLCLNEGLAEYYGTLRIAEGGRKVTFGKENAAHLRLLSEKGLLPLETLLAVDYGSAEYNESDARKLFYAESWALAHYLLHGDERGGLERFKKFLALLAEGASLQDGMKQAFGADLAAIEKGLKAYVRRQPLPASVASSDAPLKFDEEMRASQMSDAEAQAYLADLLLHLNRTDEAELYVQKSLALNPELPLAQTTLGMLRVRQQKVNEAIEILRRAAANDPDNYLTQYYFAYALSREGMGAAGSVWGYPSAMAVEMRAALSRARQLAPRFIEAYRLQAFVNLALDEKLDEAESLLRRALELAPERQDIMLILAQLHLRQLDFAAAKDDVQPVLHRALDPRLREQAVGLLAEIKQTEELAAKAVIAPPTKNEKNETPPVSQPSLTNESLSAAEQAHAGGQRLAKRFKGERVRGLLTHIECMESGVALFVKNGDRTLRLHADNLRSVFFVTYVPGLDRAVTCGARTPQNLVVLTYRPLPTPRADYDGEAIAIEFVPEDVDIEP
ncbi:MAG: tetratricopeptide repeat protein [Acidobacteria bacterium]|nr:tetratricopeptide repeat protein [Acidobacteriota bacterium]